MPYQVQTVQHGRGEGSPVNPTTGRSVTGPDALGADELAEKLIRIGDVLTAHPLCDEYYQQRTANLDKVTVPLLSASNWGGMGLHSRGNFEGFTRSASEQKWLEVHGLEHWTEFYTDYGLDVQHRFFDHFLKGTDNRWDRTPRVQLNVRTVDGFVRRNEHDWPLARTRWTRFYLDLDGGALTETAPADAAAASFAARGGTLMFRTGPLAEQTEITGPAAMKVFARSSTEDADLFVTLHLFDPDGTEVLFVTAFEPQAPLSQGWLRMSHRATDPTLSRPYRPWHPHEELVLLVPGETYEADVEIWPTSIIAPAGYRIGLSVRGTDYEHGLPGKHHVAYGRELRGSGPYWHEHPGERDAPVYDGTTTLVSTDGRLPYVLLPVIPGTG
jgi:predicted acyl esterase